MPAEFAPSKVPEVTLWFWLIKILTTGLGETTSDFLAHRYDPALAVIGAGLIFAIALFVQFSASGYNRGLYWFAVTMVSVFGTMAADVVHLVLGVPYAASSIGFAVALAAIFFAWQKSERTLSIHSIFTRRREGFYWAAVLATFALGTAVGDLTATTLNLGYLGSGLMFAAAFGLAAAGYVLTRGSVLGFWLAYVLTRPFGASFADWMGVSHQRGGLNWGTGPVSLVLFVIAFVLVAVFAGQVTGKDAARLNAKPRSSS